jgi:hypothetical protein
MQWPPIADIVPGIDAIPRQCLPLIRNEEVTMEKGKRPVAHLLSFDVSNVVNYATLALLNETSKVSLEGYQRADLEPR